jgi:hypothetical protein
VHVIEPVAGSVYAAHHPHGEIKGLQGPGHLEGAALLVALLLHRSTLNRSWEVVASFAWSPDP